MRKKRHDRSKNVKFDIRKNKKFLADSFVAQVTQFVKNCRAKFLIIRLETISRASIRNIWTQKISERISEGCKRIDAKEKMSLTAFDLCYYLLAQCMKKLCLCLLEEIKNVFQRIKTFKWGWRVFWKEMMIISAIINYFASIFNEFC